MPAEPLGFEQFKFSPSDGLRNTDYSPSQPESEDAIRDQIQGISDQLRDFINGITEQLASVDHNSSGAHRIGASPVAGLSSTNIGGQLNELKAAVDGAVLGQIPDASLVTDKISDGAVTTKKISDSAVTPLKLAEGLSRYRKIITESCIWSPPDDGYYNVTLIGGGGGGGGGSPKYGGNAGSGGASSVPVTRKLYLFANTEYILTIGAGGAGQSTNTYKPRDGGETSFAATPGRLWITSERMAGGAYMPSVCSLDGQICHGATGAGLGPGLDASNAGPSIAEPGSGNGGIPSGEKADRTGKDATVFGYGGGGGAAYYNGTSSEYGRGGNGANGAIIINWFE